MYIYTKKNGLNYGSSKHGVQIDVMSDIHLDFYMDFNADLPLSVEKFIEDARGNLEMKKDEILIISGDISHSNNASEEFLRQVAKKWKNVLVIPGNHDWYLQKKKDDRYKDLIESLNNVENIVFLMDKVNIFEYKNIKIGGSIMFYDLSNGIDFLKWRGTMNDGRFLSRDFVQKRHDDDVDYYNEVINNVDVFVSHVPIVNLDNNKKGFYLNESVEPVEKVLYISGHTHIPRSSINTSLPFEAINVGYGYPSESKGRSAITTIMYQEKEHWLSALLCLIIWMGFNIFKGVFFL